MQRRHKAVEDSLTKFMSLVNSAKLHARKQNTDEGAKPDRPRLRSEIPTASVRKPLFTRQHSVPTKLNYDHVDGQSSKTRNPSDPVSSTVSIPTALCAAKSPSPQVLTVPTGRGKRRSTEPAVHPPMAAFSKPKKPSKLALIQGRDEPDGSSPNPTQQPVHSPPRRQSSGNVFFKDVPKKVEPPANRRSVHFADGVLAARSSACTTPTSTCSDKNEPRIEPTKVSSRPGTPRRETTPTSLALPKEGHPTMTRTSAVDSPDISPFRLPDTQGPLSPLYAAVETKAATYTGRPSAGSDNVFTYPRRAPQPRSPDDYHESAV